MKLESPQNDKRRRHLAVRCGFTVLGLVALLMSASSGAQRAEDPEKFMISIDQQGAALQAMSTAERLYLSCIHCHGKNGNAGSSFYPRLAGQPAGYLKQQLNAYRMGVRKNTIMSSLARILSTEEVDILADYLAAQTPRRSVAESSVPARQLAKGEAKAVQLACAGCHGGDYMGQGAYPRLAGQGYDYLASQLKNFRDGHRLDPNGVKAGLTSVLSDKDIEDVSAYLSDL